MRIIYTKNKYLKKHKSDFSSFFGFFKTKKKKTINTIFSTPASNTLERCGLMLYVDNYDKASYVQRTLFSVITHAVTVGRSGLDI